VVRALEEAQAAFPPGAMAATFLSNHDQVRVATVLEGDEGKQRSAAAMLLTLPGTPFVYYGEKLGLPNGPRGEGDPAKRRPLPWNGTEEGGFTTGTPWAPLVEGWQQVNVAAAQARADSLLNRYRRLIHLRRGTPALRVGALQVLPVEPRAPSVLAFVRQEGSERVLVAYNLSGTEASVSPTLPGAPGELLFTDPGVKATEAAGTWQLVLPAHATGVWRLR
jgi:alpha-amylase